MRDEVELGLTLSTKKTAVQQGREVKGLGKMRTADKVPSLSNIEKERKKRVY